MSWTVEFFDDFAAEVESLPRLVRRELLSQLHILGRLGPLLGRPQVDTLNGSRYANMKELRFNADDGVWRVAFAFDSRRQAVLLVGGSKSSGSERRFYKVLIKTADSRFDRHLARLQEELQNAQNT